MKNHFAGAGPLTFVVRSQKFLAVCVDHDSWPMRLGLLLVSLPALLHVTVKTRVILQFFALAQIVLIMVILLIV